MNLLKIKEISGQSINNADLSLWWFYLLILIIALVGSYLGSYTRRKGEHTVTKKDLASITKRIEELHAQYIEQMSNATVDIVIGGPETVTLTSGPSDSAGIAEATWQTQKPNKKGQGGTAQGAYTASTTDVTVSGYHWDGVTTSTTFTIQ